MNQGPRFNPYNHGHRSQYAQPLNYLVPQQRPLQQNFNYPAPQRHPFQQIPQPFHNQSENDDRSWIERAVVYKAVTQNQQPYNTHRAFTPNQQAYQPYNQQRVHKVQENYQRVPQAHAYSRAHAPYSRAPFGHPPISVNQNHSNYPRAINPPQAFNARAQSNQRISTANALRNQPALINRNTFSPPHNRGPIISIQPYTPLDLLDSQSLLNTGYTIENFKRKKSDALPDQAFMDNGVREEWEVLKINFAKNHNVELTKQSAEIDELKNQYLKYQTELEASNNVELKEWLAKYRAELEKVEADVEQTREKTSHFQALIPSTKTSTTVKNSQRPTSSVVGFVDEESSRSQDSSGTTNNSTTEEVSGKSVSWSTDPNSVKSSQDSVPKASFRPESSRGDSQHANGTETRTKGTGIYTEECHNILLKWQNQIRILRETKPSR